MKDESKKKSEGIWVRGKVVSQEGAMVLVHIHKSVLRVNQSKVRRDHDPWHDVAVPLNPEPAVPEGEGAAGSGKVRPNIRTCVQGTNANAVLSTRFVCTPSPVRRAIL